MTIIQCYRIYGINLKFYLHVSFIINNSFKIYLRFLLWVIRKASDHPENLEHTLLHVKISFRCVQTLRICSSPLNELYWLHPQVYDPTPQ